MTDEDDEASPDEIATGTTEFVQYLEECDSMYVNYLWNGLMEGTIVLYDFRKVDRG